MSDLAAFLLLTLVISIVHVLVTRTARSPQSVRRETTRYFLSAAGGMLLLGLIIEVISELFQ
ncbi:MAG: hypothetical protein HN891_00115 [Planctomycetes bacterium]|jgi:hypothetical protein|nr:hypothetical protein [Planctomycetota bacterium]MBT6453490.1 hypothetical protein [Planctomycetota bacterium]MBT6541514.1 hypothetical protein [Planctomycetota bacterium]MBT6785723.1 hypothetical protein [Planctomycetota bacterium]MBT6967838.1 hypothetical protein [Planctomycetota bacterium]